MQMPGGRFLRQAAGRCSPGSRTRERPIMTAIPANRQSPGGREPEPVDGGAQAGATAVVEEGWERLITEAAARVRLPVVAQRYAGGLTSASRPQKFECDDGNLYAVKFRGNPHGNGRAIFTEQVVGLLGRLVGAPVPEVRLVSVTAELLASLSIDFN